MNRISKDHRGYLRFFAFFLANGTLCDEVLDDLDYSSILDWPSGLEQVFAIFCNTLVTDDEGIEIKPGHAEKRAAQYIRQCCDSNYVVNPPFTSEELELHM